MHFSLLSHGAAGPFDELILGLYAVQTVTFLIALLRARWRRRSANSGLKVEKARTRQSGKTVSD